MPDCIVCTLYCATPRSGIELLKMTCSSWLGLILSTAVFIRNRGEGHEVHSCRSRDILGARLQPLRREFYLSD